LDKPSLLSLHVSLSSTHPVLFEGWTSLVCYPYPCSFIFHTPRSIWRLDKPSLLSRHVSLSSTHPVLFEGWTSLVCYPSMLVYLPYTPVPFEDWTSLVCYPSMIKSLQPLWDISLNFKILICCLSFKTSGDLLNLCLSGHYHAWMDCL